jgi:GAF domain-containing protein
VRPNLRSASQPVVRPRSSELEPTLSAVAHKPRWSEAERLAALYAYDILDTLPEQEFDELARIAAYVCSAPIALVNFLAEDRQWFKAEIGLGRKETPIDLAFCTHAILQPDLFVVPDTTQDIRFNCNPLVTEEPYLRFYAGALIVTNAGVPVGTLCVLDYVPRPGISLEQGNMLLALAHQATLLLELRLTRRRLAEYERRLT